MISTISYFRYFIFYRAFSRFCAHVWWDYWYRLKLWPWSRIIDYLGDLSKLETIFSLLLLLLILSSILSSWQSLSVVTLSVLFLFIAVTLSNRNSYYDATNFGNSKVSEELLWEASSDEDEQELEEEDERDDEWDSEELYYWSISSLWSLKALILIFDLSLRSNFARIDFISWSSS